MALNRGTPPLIPPPPFGGGMQPYSAMTPGPPIGFQVGADGNPDPLNVGDLPVRRVEPGRGGRQPTLSGTEFTPGIRKA